MNKKFLVAWIVAFVVFMAGDYAVHGAWLASQYAQLPSLYRPMDTQPQYMPYMIGAHVLIAGAIAWVYGRGVNASAWAGQGIRFGIAMAFIMAPLYLVYYSVQPLPLALVMSQACGEAVVMIVTGVATAFVYKGATAT